MSQVSSSHSPIETSPSVSQGLAQKWPPNESPKWILVECMAHPSKRGAPWSLRCKYCGKEFIASFIIRVRDHYFGGKDILPCKANPIEILDTICVAVIKLIQEKKS